MRHAAALALVTVAVTPLTVLGNEETLLEEIVVTASFVGINESSATRPIHKWCSLPGSQAMALSLPV